MSTERKFAGAPLDELLQSVSLSPGLPVTPEDADAIVLPEPESKPDTLLDQVLRAHPALTREEAIAEILEFGGDPFEDLRVIYAWRRRGQRAYDRIPRSSPGTR